MYAIIEAGGKQFKVMAGDVIKVEKIDAEIGSKVDYQALFVSDENGNIQTLDNAKKVKVTAEVVAQGKNPKIIVFKFKRRKNYKRTKGHKEQRTLIKIESINA